MQCYLLIDYDNVKPIRSERRLEDVQYNIGSIADAAAKARRDQFPSAHEIVLRLYGGWINIHGAYTSTADWVVRSLHIARGRRYGARVVPHLVETMLCSPGKRLSGTYRAGHQKMVDTMICVDTIYISSSTNCQVGVLSDDDDLIPALMYSSVIRKGALCGRKRSYGDGINDRVAHDFGVTFHRY